MSADADIEDVELLSSLSPMSGDDVDASELLAARRAKLERLRSEGVDPFPHDFDGVEAIASVRPAYDGLAAGEETTVSHRVAGRLAARREAGRAAFLDLVDRSGRIQLLARVDELGEDGLARSGRPRPRRPDRRRRGRDAHAPRRALAAAERVHAAGEVAAAATRRAITASATSRRASAGASST